MNFHVDLFVHYFFHLAGTIAVARFSFHSNPSFMAALLLLCPSTVPPQRASSLPFFLFSPFHKLSLPCPHSEPLVPLSQFFYRVFGCTSPLS